MNIKEQVLNTEIGNFLKRCLPDAEVKIEENNQLKNKNYTPDLTVTRSGRENILIENKNNENELTKQCQQRLRDKWQDDQAVRIVIGLLSPDKIYNSKQLKKELSENNDFRWCFWTEQQRFPQKGWLQGNLYDFAGFIDRASIDALDLDELVDDIKIMLQSLSKTVSKHIHVPGTWAEILKQEEGEQTIRMALAILLNAVLFQAQISEIDDNKSIESPDFMYANNRIKVIYVHQQWQEILKINYAPIFELADKLLMKMNSVVMFYKVFNYIFSLVSEISKNTFSQGLVGLIFGELIKDRKLLASFYTMPTSATLISELALLRLDTDWSKKDKIKSLRIGDLAVGTGSLLVAAYQRIVERYMLSGGRSKNLHPILLEDVLTGCDIEPAAVNITAARLSGEHPNVAYKKTKLYTLAFGAVGTKKRHKEIKIGSLDLLNNNCTIQLFGSEDKVADAKISSKKSSKFDARNLIHVPHNSMDVIIMNPPFTRPTNHEGGKKNISNPAFAALGNSKETQKTMSDILKSHLDKLPKPLASHGNAGLVTNFMDLAHLKLKNDGIIALIIPSSFISGSAWSNMRKLLNQHYYDITLISISAQGDYERNWSSDTSLNEIILIANKSLKLVNTNEALYVSLNERPQNNSEAIEVALGIREKNNYLKIGDNIIGWQTKCLFDEKMESGSPVGVLSEDLVKLSRGLLSQKLILPRIQSLDIIMTLLNDFGCASLVSRDINEKSGDGKKPRGAFDLHILKDRQKHQQVSYPILWNHDVLQERFMMVNPDCEGKIRPNMKEEALKTWNGYESKNRHIAGATQLHISMELSTNSHFIQACLTPYQAIGGRAWPSFALNKINFDIVKAEKIVCLWLNTSLGLISRWYISNRQQTGRSMLSVTTIGNIPVIDLNKLNKKQIDQLSNLFDKYVKKEFQPIHLMHQDKIRQALDEEVLCNVLSLSSEILNPLQIIRNQWSQESSVRSSKKRKL